MKTVKLYSARLYGNNNVTEDPYRTVSVSPAGFLGSSVGPGSPTSSGTEEKRIKETRNEGAERSTEGNIDGETVFGFLCSGL